MLLLVGFSGFQLIQVDTCFSFATWERETQTGGFETKNGEFDNRIPSVAAPNSREGYAIVCGVSDYPGDDNDLEYCDDDANNIDTFLQNEFLIPSENIVKLVNADATTEEILNVIGNFSQQMDENDILFFSYSGHGSNATIETHSWEIESPHPYANYADTYWSYSAPGADMMRVHFTRISTEDGYDAVFLGDNNERVYYYDLFTGSYTDVWSFWMPVDDVYVNLYSDYSFTDWGFAVDEVEAAYFGQSYYIHPYDSLNSGLSGTMLKDALDDVPGSTICVLDSCNSGGVAEELAGENRLIIAASQADEYSLEDPNIGEGVFTSEFLDIWATTDDINSDGGISFEEIFPVLQTNTEIHSSNLGYTHSPTLNDNIAGETMMQPSVMVNSVEWVSDEQIAIDFSINGLGIGNIHASFYNFLTHQFYSEQVLSNLASSYYGATINWNPELNYSVTGASVYMSTIYNSHVEVSTGYTESGTLLLSDTTDFDGDSLSDLEEFELGTNIWEADSDYDGLLDSAEILRGTNPLSIDTDADSLPDGWEQEYLLNPLQFDSAKDNDFDGLSNLDEYRYGTNPIKADTDDDNYSDKEEIEKGTDPLNAWSNPTTRFLLYVVGVSGVVVPSGIVYRKKHPKIRTKPQRNETYTNSDSPDSNRLYTPFHLRQETTNYYSQPQKTTPEKTPSEIMKEFDDFLKALLSDPGEER
jgi:hypothetical protein